MTDVSAPAATEPGDPLVPFTYALSLIGPQTEHFPMSRANDAMEDLSAGNARYRIVLDRN